MKYCTILLLIIALASCRVKRDIVTTKIVYDSTAVKEVEALKKARIEDKARHEQELKEASSGEIVFADCDTLPAKVTISKDGTLQAEGNIKSAKVNTSRYLHTIDSMQRVIDSFSSVKRKDSVRVQTNTITKTLHTKSSTFSLWWLVVAFVAGFVCCYYRTPIIQRLKNINRAR